MNRSIAFSKTRRFFGTLYLPPTEIHPSNSSTNLDFILCTTESLWGHNVHEIVNSFLVNIHSYIFPAISDTCGGQLGR
jgi:hypothetical protein